MTDLPGVVGFILSEATESDIDRIYDAAKQRSKALRAIRAATISVGAEVETTNLSPKYLNGLRGKVQSITGQRAVLLITDPHSLSQIIDTKYGPITLPGGPVAEYALRGVPVSSLSQL
jgi:hypothetical protein